MEPVIEVADLRFSYPDGTAALQGVDFSLHAGETVAVFGANGSGKTTFLLHLVGLLQGRGKIRVCGQDLDDSTLSLARQKIGVLFQDSDDQLFMPTVEEDVAFGPLNMALDAGEKRRVALAGVLATDPEIIVLDEPATFLDPPARAQLVAILSSLPQAKLIVTHDVDLARTLASRAVFFEKGRIAASADVEAIVERFQWDTTPALRPR